MKQTIGNLFIARGETEQGYIYKNYEAYENRTGEVCYIPELSDTAYTHKDFINIVNDKYNEDKDFANFLNQQNISCEKWADSLFELVDWQHPTALLDEWESYQ